MSETVKVDEHAAHASAQNGALSRVPVLARMCAYVILFLSLVLVVLPWLFYHLDRFVPALHVEIGSARIAGYVLGAISLTAYLASSYVLTKRGKGPFVEFDPPTELVVEGPYRFSRNPVVAFLLGTMLGEAIAFSSTGILLMFFVFAMLGHLQVLRVEEPLLTQRYGQAYLDYCQRVPRWIPRWPRKV